MALRLVASGKTPNPGFVKKSFMFVCVLVAPNLRPVVVCLREAAVIPVELIVVLATLPKGCTLAVDAAVLQSDTDPCCFA